VRHYSLRVILLYRNVAFLIEQRRTLLPTKTYVVSDEPLRFYSYHSAYTLFRVATSIVIYQGRRAFDRSGIRREKFRRFAISNEPVRPIKTVYTILTKSERYIVFRFRRRFPFGVSGISIDTASIRSV